MAEHMEGKKTSRSGRPHRSFFAPHFFAIPEHWLRLTAAPSVSWTVHARHERKREML